MQYYGVLNKDIKLKLGQKIRTLRLKKGMTQEELAEKATVDYKYLQKIEGKTPPNIKIETIEKIAKALKTTISNLVKT